MLYETIDPSEFMMVEKTSGHAEVIEENRILKLSIKILFTAAIVVALGSVIYLHQRSDRNNNS
jgi:hypothetical protein